MKTEIIKIQDFFENEIKPMYLGFDREDLLNNSVYDITQDFLSSNFKYYSNYRIIDSQNIAIVY